MSRFAPIGAALCAGFAAWLSQGTIGFSAADGGRLAILPVSAVAWVVAGLAGLLVLALRRAGASLLPLCLLALLLLPWLPFRVPAAFLIWVAPLSTVIWTAVLLIMAASVPWARGLQIARAHLAAGLAAFAIFALAAWRAAPMIPGGDEPHYLVIAQSLLLDGDLTIEDVHRRGDYRAYFAGDLPPHVQRRGRDGRIYSVHAPGLPVLVAPAFALAGYRGVVLLLLALAAAGSALAWHVAWMATGRSDAAWFGWAAVTFPVTAIFQSFTVYPDGAGGVLVLTGVWALLRAQQEARTGETRVRPWLLHGAALAMLPWLHSRFAVLAGGLGALLLLRLSATKNPAAKAVAFLSIPAVSAIVWVGFFVAVYGTPNPTAPYGPGEIGSFRFVPGGLAGLLFDQRFGLLIYAPVLACALAGLGAMLARAEWRRLALELLFVVFPYLLLVTHFAMWWGGWSPPARFFAPVLPLCAVPAAIAWRIGEGRVSRALASAALVLTVLASVMTVGVDRGRLAFNTREAPALWLEWAGRLADLTAAAPMWARDTDLPLFRTIAVWVAGIVLTWLALRAADRRQWLRGGTHARVAAAAALAIAIMTGSTIAWAIQGASGRTTVASQLQLLEAVASSRRSIAMQLTPWTRLHAPDVPNRLRIELTRRPARGPGGRDAAPLFTLPPLPAGAYRLTVEAERQRGWLMIGVSRDPRDPFALLTVQLKGAPIDLHFPVPIRALTVRGDEDARREVGALRIEPLAVARSGERLSAEPARRAARYGGWTVYFQDEASFPEPEAFWVGGARRAMVVLQPDAPRSSARVILRNAPVDNRVTLAAGTWRRELAMGAGEEQVVEIPLDAARNAALLRIEATTGFRPAERDPASRDRRFLGVWVKLAPD